MLPSYKGVRIADDEDVYTIWRAFHTGFIQAISSEDIQGQSSLIEGGNLVIYNGERYRDGEKWQKSSSSRDHIVVEINENLKIKKVSVSCTGPSVCIISYVPLDEGEEKKIPRAVELFVLPNEVDPGQSIESDVALRGLPLTASHPSMEFQWSTYGLSMALPPFTSEPSTAGNHPAFVNAQPEHGDFHMHNVSAQNDVLFPPQGNQVQVMSADIPIFPGSLGFHPNDASVQNDVLFPRGSQGQVMSSDMLFYGGSLGFHPHDASAQMFPHGSQRQVMSSDMPLFGGSSGFYAHDASAQNDDVLPLRDSQGQVMSSDVPLFDGSPGSLSSDGSNSNDDVFPLHGSQLQVMSSDAPLLDGSPGSLSSDGSNSTSLSPDEFIGLASDPLSVSPPDEASATGLHWRINTGGLWDQGNSGSPISNSAALLLPYTVLQCTKKSVGILSANTLADRSQDRFEEFCLCLHADDIPQVVIDTFFSQQTGFLSRLLAVDSNSLRCFGATETFIIDYQGETRLLGCLAVVLPELDSEIVSETIPANSVHFTLDFVLLPTATYREAVPSTWLETQLLGSHFPTERQKRVAWALGQLPSASYYPGSSTFKCIYQYWTSIGLSSGSRHVVQLHSPGTALSSLASFKLCLYHPANASLASRLVSLLDERLREACEDCVEEWLIAVYEARRHPPSGLDSAKLQQLYCEYMRNLFQMQADSFQKAGYADEVLHQCASAICPHDKPSFRGLPDQLSYAFDRMVDSMTKSLHVADYPSPILRKQARELGLMLYWFQSSYVLLQPHEKVLHDSYCRPRLNEMRATLSERVFPAPALIWNYLPHHLQSKLREVRLSLGNEWIIRTE